MAIRRLAMGLPSCVRRISGSAPKLPTKMTLLTLPAILHSCLFLQLFRIRDCFRNSLFHQNRSARPGARKQHRNGTPTVSPIFSFASSHFPQGKGIACLRRDGNFPNSDGRCLQETPTPGNASPKIFHRLSFTHSMYLFCSYHFCRNVAI